MTTTTDRWTHPEIILGLIAGEGGAAPLETIKHLAYGFLIPYERTGEIVADLSAAGAVEIEGVMTRFVVRLKKEARP